MQVFIDRISKNVYIQGASPKWACSVGYYFARNHFALAPWGINALNEGEVVPISAPERHRIESHACGAGEIASFITDMPKRPHDCPSCDCPPECCR